jgi:hypothetical protein
LLIDAVRRDLLGGFNFFTGRHNHHQAVEKDCEDDRQREERVNQDVDGHPTNGAERRQSPDGRFGRKPKDVFSFANDNKRLEKKRKRKERNVALSSKQG